MRREIRNRFWDFGSPESELIYHSTRFVNFKWKFFYILNNYLLNWFRLHLRQRSWGIVARDNK